MNPLRLVLACMLSKMRANHMDWSPYRIRLALENTASSNANEEKFGCGQGLIQVWITSSAYKFGVISVV